MSSALAIWGAVTGSLVALNIIKGWVTELRQFLKEAKEAQLTLQQIRNECEASEADLEVWAKMWGIDKNVSEKYQTKLWGKSGSRVISQHVTMVLRLHDEIKKTLKEFLEQSGMLKSHQSQKQSTAGESSTQGARFGVILRRVSQNEHKMTIRKTLKFVSSKCPDLLQKLGTARTQITDMKARAKQAYLITNQPKHALSDDIVTTKALEEVRNSILFQLAYESRLASKGLYQSCHAASKTTYPESIEDIMLEMDLYRRDVADSPNVTTLQAMVLQYQLLIAWPRKTLEVLVEGPFDPEKAPDQYENGVVDFYRACIEASSSEKQLFPIVGAPSATWFRACVPPINQRIISSTNPFIQNHQQLQQLKPLAKLLYKLDTNISGEPADKFPRSERIRLAFKILECGLFLSGTSWFSGLKSNSIQVQRSRVVLGEPRRFILQTQASKREYEDNDFRQFAEQAFTIGVLLVEIGTGRLVHQIPPCVKGLGQGFSLYAPQTNPPAKATLFSGAQIQNLLDVEMGSLFATSVKVCLQSRESWRRAVKHTAEERAEVYEGILADYYLEVYLP